MVRVRNRLDLTIGTPSGVPFFDYYHHYYHALPQNRLRFAAHKGMMLKCTNALVHRHRERFSDTYKD